MTDRVGAIFMFWRSRRRQYFRNGRGRCFALSGYMAQRRSKLASTNANEQIDLTRYFRGVS